MVTSDLQLTPRELADAIGASESSLRRWVDSGDIRITRTVGGHRRIPLAEAVRFVRQIGAKILRPHILGLPEIDNSEAARGGPSEERSLFDFLRTGNRVAARGLILSAYLSGRSLASV